MKRKVIIDCDPGIDDAFALVAAFSAPDIEILGLTTTAGNKGLDAVTKNALRLKKLMNVPVKIYAGKESQISDTLDAAMFHGGDGMGNSNLLFDMNELQEETASDFIIAMVKQYPHEIDLITIGPLTNVAQALKKDAEVMKNLRSIYMMGGGLYRGNVTQYAEFNFYFDTEATAAVINDLADFVEIQIMTLDASHKTLFTAEDSAFIKDNGGKVGEMLAHIFQPYADAYHQANGYNGAVIHDLLLVLYYLNPNIVSKISEESLMIITEGEKKGQTVLDANGKKVKLILDMNDVDWKNDFISIVFPEKYSAFLLAF